jgi:hypothetical protein
LKHPTVRLAVLLAVVVAAFAALTGGASATSCGQKVIDDWYGSKTGQLSKTYPIHCYREALDKLKGHSDIAIYSSAQQDITRAMQLAILASHNKGNGTGSGPGGPTPSLTDPNLLPSFLGGPDAKNGGHPPNGVTPAIPKTTPKPTPPPIIPFPSSSPSSVPLPAIILGAIAALLLALGAAAYIARRRQTRRQTLRPRHANGHNP